jgi:hypothetical protein
MLRQLARLTVPVESAGERACAIAVYADAADRTFPATDRGFEGVACVDDAARGLILFTDIWLATRLPRMREWALGLLDFLLYMQLDDGRFVNFISDWSGQRNEAGVTSFPGGNFWHARGMHALARATVVFGQERARAALERGLGHIRSARDVPPDVRSIHALMAVELLRAGEFAELRAELPTWCDEIAACRREGVLFDNPDQLEPHLGPVPRTGRPHRHRTGERAHLSRATHRLGFQRTDRAALRRRVGRVFDRAPSRHHRRAAFR